MDDKNKGIPKNHKIYMEDCKKATITGVNDVISFDLKSVLLETSCGVLVIKGDNLHVSRLTLEKGELEVDGRISGMNYSDTFKFTKKSRMPAGKLLK